MKITNIDMTTAALAARPTPRVPELAWKPLYDAMIPIAEQYRVFARFYRSSARRGSDGAGLGLSIVQAIAAAHGGRLELASVPGSGATFTVVLPVGGPDMEEGGEP